MASLEERAFMVNLLIEDVVELLLETQILLGPAILFCDSTRLLLWTLDNLISELQNDLRAR